VCAQSGPTSGEEELEAAQRVEGASPMPDDQESPEVSVVELKESTVTATPSGGAVRWRRCVALPEMLVINTSGVAVERPGRAALVPLVRLGIGAERCVACSRTRA
jgi:hypothetical protein